MMLSDLLQRASDEAGRISRMEDGTERVRLEALSTILTAEARVARQKEAPKLNHLCGAHGFNPWLGDTCEACEARRTA